MGEFVLHLPSPSKFPQSNGSGSRWYDYKNTSKEAFDLTLIQGMAKTLALLHFHGAEITLQSLNVEAFKCN